MKDVRDNPQSQVYLVQTVPPWHGAKEVTVITCHCTTLDVSKFEPEKCKLHDHND